MGRVISWDHNFEFPRADSPQTRLLEAELLRQGVSASGATQFTAGEPITNASDRLLLAEILRTQLGLAIQTGDSKIALLLPAVQAAREAAKPANQQQWAETIEKLGVSYFGANQFLSGLPISKAEDRRQLALVAAAASGASQSSHPGGANFAMMDGSVRF